MRSIRSRCCILTSRLALVFSGFGHCGSDFFCFCLQAKNLMTDDLHSIARF